MALNNAIYRYYFELGGDTLDFRKFHSSVLGFNVCCFSVTFVALYFLSPQLAPMIFTGATSGHVLFLAAVILVLGSLFEIIQNHIDRWFVSTESASGNGYSLMDGLFTFFILLGQALILIALIGQSNIVKAFAVICVLAGPILY